MKQIFIFVILFLSFFCSAQENLIPNPGFEIYRKRPIKMSESADEFDATTVAWYSINSATPDIYCNRNTGKIFLDAGSVSKSYEGNCSLGLVLYHPDHNYNEYVQCKLRNSMISGKKYKLSFFVKLADDASFNANNLSFYFSQDKFQDKTTMGIVEKPAQIISRNVFDKNREWRKLIFFFKPKEEYKYLSIGNFTKRKDTIEDSIGSKLIDKKPLVYIYLDDFSLVETIDLNEIFNPNKIYFDNDKYEIKPKSLLELEKLLEFLKKNENKKLTITGFTDSKGDENYNLNLSKLRACAIKEYLIKNGISQERLECIGKGKAKECKVEFEIK
jgi:OmpA-OmpF porin, OOP family